MVGYKLVSHQHGDHSHFKLERKGDTFLANPHGHHRHAAGAECGSCETDEENNKIGRSDEGCPCCAAAIDLDEVATALNEISANTANTSDHKLGDLADFSSAAHWGIFLGISGPLALIGLTAAFRNIKGTLNNKSKLDLVIKGLEQDIAKYKEQRNSNTKIEDRDQLLGVIQRLEAFKETLKYSEFDTKFNLIVPGFINGTASTVVLSSAIISSPLALPVIALYAGCQTARNGYDLWRTWNKILPEDIREEVELNMKVGIRKINQITDSKRKFYAANSLGFAAFTAGALITTVSALSVVGAPGVLVGIPLLATGAVSTGITNNIWTNKFKPRNADLGIERTKLDLENIKQEIGERREIKKLLKNYRDKHLPAKLIKRFGYSLLSSLPFNNEKGAKLLHDVNQSRISESDSSDEDRLDLLLRMINAKIILKETGNQNELDSLLKKISGLAEISEEEKIEFNLMRTQSGESIYQMIFSACEELKIDEMVLERFIKNSIIKSADEHDSSIGNQTDYLGKLQNSGLFKIGRGREKGVINFDLRALEVNEEYKKAFMNALEECLLFDYVEKLKYEQYGLNDFFWALDRQNKKQTLVLVKEKLATEPAASSSHVHSASCSHGNTLGSEKLFCAPSNAYPNAKKKKPKGTETPKIPEIQNPLHSIETDYSFPTPIVLEDTTQQTVIDIASDNQENIPPIPNSNKSEAVKKELNKTSISRQGENINIEKSLLIEFNSLASERISADKNQREKQITKQNQTIDKLLKKSREFILKSQTKNSQKNQTIFVYADPYYPDLNSLEGRARQVIYVRDDASGKINVLYAEKSRALIIDRPSEKKNGLISKISNNKVEHYGQKDGSIFQSFTKILQTDLPNSIVTKPNSSKTHLPSNFRQKT